MTFSGQIKESLYAKMSSPKNTATNKSVVDFQSIYESFPDMCLSLEASTGRIVSCNQTVIDTLGYNEEEILNATLFDLYHPSQKEKVENNLWSIANSKRPANTEFIVQKKNGELIPVTLKLNFVRDENGKILYTNAVWRDITELKRVQLELEEQKRKVEAQSELISQKNKEFTDAINYAKHIQDGILPSQSEICQSLPNSFVFYQPRGIVSGDFYWMYQHEKRVLFSVADCTGHGVPGAFMSMVGAALFNEIVIEHRESSPDEILNLMRAGIIKSLNKGRDEYKVSNGMDASLCALDLETKALEFSGANSSLIIVRKGGAKLVDFHGNELSIEPKLIKGDDVLYEIKGDKQPIGYYGGMGSVFSKTYIQLQEGDQIYLSSDGFPDQLGGERNKKFLSKRFKELVLEIAYLNMQDQRKLLDKTFQEWKGEDGEQTDDVCVWGVRI